MEGCADRVSEDVIPQRGERVKAQDTKKSKGSGLRTVPTTAMPPFFFFFLSVQKAAYWEA